MQNSDYHFLIIIFRILKGVRIVHVMAPPTPSSSRQSPVKVSVITGKLASASPPTKAPPTTSSSPSSSLHMEDPLKGLTNGLPEPNHTADITKKPASVKETKPKTPLTPKSPLSPEVNSDPANYRYEVEYVNESAPGVIVKPIVLSRPKGSLAPKKLKVFLRNAMWRPSEKHPLTVKASSKTISEGDEAIPHPQTERGRGGGGGVSTSEYSQ